MLSKLQMRGLGFFARCTQLSSNIIYLKFSLYLFLNPSRSCYLFVKRPFYLCPSSTLIVFLFLVTFCISHPYRRRLSVLTQHPQNLPPKSPVKAATPPRVSHQKSEPGARPRYAQRAMHFTRSMDRGSRGAGGFSLFQRGNRVVHTPGSRRMTHSSLCMVHAWFKNRFSCVLTIRVAGLDATT